MNVPTDGIYTFYVDSADGSSLSVGGVQVVNNDGVHGAQEVSGTLGLKAGWHAITVDYFEQSDSPLLQVSYSGPGIAKEVIPDASLEATSLGNVYVHNYGAVGDGVTNDSGGDSGGDQCSARITRRWCLMRGRPIYWARG